MTLTILSSTDLESSIPASLRNATGDEVKARFVTYREHDFSVETVRSFVEVYYWNDLNDPLYDDEVDSVTEARAVVSELEPDDVL